MAGELLTLKPADEISSSLERLACVALGASTIQGELIAIHQTADKGTYGTVRVGDQLFAGKLVGYEHRGPTPA